MYLEEQLSYEEISRKNIFQIVYVDYMPVDKLCLYATSKEEAKENEIANPDDKLIQDFVVTSDYEIRLTDYTGKYKAEIQKVYHIDPSRHFSEDDEIDYEGKPAF